MIWMKELEDKGLDKTHQLKSIISAVLQWIPHIFKYTVFHNKVFSFIQFSFLKFHYLFSCSPLIFCYFIFYGQSCLMSTSYTANVSLSKILIAKILDTVWNKWKRFWPHNLQHVRWDHLYTHQFLQCRYNGVFVAHRESVFECLLGRMLINNPTESRLTRVFPIQVFSEITQWGDSGI